MRRGSRVGTKLRNRYSARWYLFPLMTLAAIAFVTPSGSGQARLSVPDVRFHTYAQAQCILRLHGLNVRPNGVPGTVRGPVVVRQEPEAGGQLGQGDTVVVTLGPPFAQIRPVEVAVPFLPVGTQIDTARGALQKWDLCAATDPPGARTGGVVEQVPPGGTRVPKGTTITLRIGQAPGSSNSMFFAGNAGEPRRVPDVVGRLLPEAAHMLVEAGFVVGRVTKVASDETPGTVTAQTPRGGTAAAPRTGVDLWVAVRIPEPRLRVPNVLGQLLDDAARVLGKAGFTVGRVTRVPTEEAAGTVTAQTPEAGTFAPPRTGIDLTVAVPRRVRVPDVVGRPLAEAARMLEEAGFGVGRVTRTASNETPGTVTTQTPEGGAFAPPKTAVALTVAVSPQVPVPDVVGQPLDDATRTLAKAGFAAGPVTRTASNETPGTVTTQTPAGGTLAPPKSAVALAVAVSPQVLVPDVVGQSLDDAARTLAKAGFSVGRVTRTASNEAAETVTGQTPEGGTAAPPRTSVALTVAAARPPDEARVPDVVGQSLHQATRRLAEADFVVGGVTRAASSEAAGTVIGQTPGGGTIAPRKTAIALTVAIPAVPDKIPVPDVVGRSSDVAARILVGAGFTVGRVTRAASSEAPGTVIEQTPEGGTLAPLKTAVALTVAIPAVTDKITVPDVVGRSPEVAAGILANAGFRVGQVTRAASNIAPGTVAKQAPVGGTVVTRPLPAVDLTLAAVKVPDVVGQLLDPAKGILGQANFGVQTTLQPSDKPRGTVTNQDPVADALVIPPLPVVKLTVAAAEVPSVVGRSLGVAIRTLGDAGFASVATGWPQVAFARVIDQKPIGGTFVTSAQTVVAITVPDAGRWLPTIVAFLLGVGGTVAASKVRPRNGPAPHLIRMTARRDLGTQEICLDTTPIGGEADILKETDVHVRPVRDLGNQAIERPEDVLPLGESDDHD